ncbi:MAG: YihY/virulence factor BrkB family protein [Actinobacteria bacterium]|nr:YihY/virulence factor BrkB family protein [Actinomycetota bacterium]
MVKEHLYTAIKNKVIIVLIEIREFFAGHSRSLQENHRPVRVLFSAVGEFRKERMSIHSGYFAYNAFMAIFALLLFMSAILGYILHSHPDLYMKIMKNIYDALPDLGESFQNTLGSITRNRSLVSAIGLFGLLWSGSRLFNAIAKGFARIWPEKKQSFIVRRTIAGFLILVIVLLFTASISFHFVSTSLISKLTEPGHISYKVLYHSTTILVTILTSILLFFFIYLVIPAIKQPLSHVIKASIISGSLFLIIQYLLNIYFTEISRANVLYGVIGGVIGILVWLHLLGMVTFFGAELIKSMADQDALEAGTARSATEIETCAQL